MGWLDTRGGKFTVREAYEMANGWSRGRAWKGWGLIWILCIQQRVMYFFWLPVHEKILINQVRWKMKLAHVPKCARCASELKTQFMQLEIAVCQGSYGNS